MSLAADGWCANSRYSPPAPDLLSCLTAVITSDTNIIFLGGNSLIWGASCIWLAGSNLFLFGNTTLHLWNVFYCLDVVLKCNHQQHQSRYSLYCWKCVNWDQFCLPIVLPSHQHKLYNCWWNTLDWWRLEEGEGVGEIVFNQIDLDEGIKVQSYQPSHPLWGSGVESLLQCFISWLLHF